MSADQIILEGLKAMALGGAGCALFAAADRGIGRGQRSLHFGLVFVYAAAAWLAGERFVAWVALSWAFYRSLPWSIGGTTTPRTQWQKVASFCRHAYPAALASAAYTAGLAPWALAWAAMLFLLVYAAYATKLAVHYAEEVDYCAAWGRPEPDWLNATQEEDRGFAFGIAFAVCVGLAALLGG